ncbi:MAG: 2-oxo acid dehydrogenase subunit E2 [Verrucomicrobiae bacterium]|nr:2-oxo acid dehydrogenase subunit E2 [Verrucomicrobiae bacterium]MCP5540452.1 2-oxo acid dehydrogenase subunit E2 [Akkermansiaceae bacterium]
MPRVPLCMPQLGESIAEAAIREIGIAAGDDISADQEVFQVETDKAMMGVTTPATGRVLEIIAKVDESYAVGATLAYLEVTDEEIQRAGLTKPSDTAPIRPVKPRTEEDQAAENALADGDDGQSRPHFAIDESEFIEIDVNPEVKPTVEGLPVPASATGATYLSPRMKARMEELGLNAADLSGVAGSGAGGRVTIEDFEKFIREIEKNKMTAASPMRIAVADSMRRSWTRPLATVGMPVSLDAVLAHRKASDPKSGIALYAIRALALALSENTAVAGRLIGERIVHPKAIDIGFAVEVEDGVLVPVMRDVADKTLAELTAPYDELVRRGRDRRLPPEAMGTGIATVTNFGTFGIVWATPIPLPEQNLVLGLGAGRKVPHWDDAAGEFVPRVEADLTLSFDHRILDGGAAGRLLQKIDSLLQRPETL